MDIIADLKSMEPKQECNIEPKSITTVIVHLANVDMKDSGMKSLVKLEAQLVEPKVDATIASNSCQKMDIKYFGNRGTKRAFKYNPDVAPLNKHLFNGSGDTKEQVVLRNCSVVLKRVTAEQRRYVV